jgi:hypothetical protein
MALPLPRLTPVWLTDRPTDWLADRPTDRLTGWLADWLTDWLTPLCRIILEHLIIIQLIEKFPVVMERDFYGRTAKNTNLGQVNPLNFFTTRVSEIHLHILPFMPLSLGFPNQNLLRVYYFPAHVTCPDHCSVTLSISYEAPCCEFSQSRDSSVGIALGYGLDNRSSRVRFLVGLRIFLFITASRTDPRPTQPPIQWVPGALSLGLKPPSRAEVEIVWSYISTPPTRLHGVVLS